MRTKKLKRQILAALGPSARVGTLYRAEILPFEALPGVVADSVVNDVRYDGIASDCQVVVWRRNNGKYRDASLLENFMRTADANVGASSTSMTSGDAVVFSGDDVFVAGCSVRATP